MAKKSLDDFKKEVFDQVGDEYTVLGNLYKNNKTKIKMRHNTCNYEFEMRPHDFLRGQRCPKCNKKPKGTNNSFKKEVFDQVGDEYTVLGDYVNNQTKIKMRHNTCGHEYEVTPNNFISKKRRCPECFGNKKKDTNSFKQEVFDQVGDEYTVLGEYINNQTKIKIRHNTCGHEYEVEPVRFTGKANARCPKCFGNKKITINIFKQEVKDLVGDEYTVLSNIYKDGKTKIKMRHNTCGHEYEVVRNKFLNGRRCPKCNGNNPYTTESFKEKIKELEDDEYTVLGDYVNSQTKIKMRHNTCGHEYEVTPNNFISKGTRCPKCSSSKGNEYILDYLIKNNINFKDEESFETCKYKKQLPFDFYIPHLKLLIEYDGDQHFMFKEKYHKTEEGFQLQLKRDQIKNQWCKDNKVSLIRISYKDFNNLEKILDDIFISDKKLHPKQYNSIYIYLSEKELLLETGIYKTLPKVEILNE